jgi:hypothetical protein
MISQSQPAHEAPVDQPIAGEVASTDRTRAFASWLAGKKDALFRRVVEIEGEQPATLTASPEDFAQAAMRAGDVAGQLRLLRDIEEYFGAGELPQQDSAPDTAESA